jgi:hypothetical protein
MLHEAFCLKQLLLVAQLLDGSLQSTHALPAPQHAFPEVFDTYSTNWSTRLAYGAACVKHQPLCCQASQGGKGDADWSNVVA